MKTTLSSKFVKSYSSEERLLKALKKNDIHEHRRIVCLTVEGRWTAILLGRTVVNGDPAGIPGKGAVLGTGFMMAS